MPTRRACLQAIAVLTASSLAPSALADDLPKPFVIYDEELKNGWESWSWAKVDLGVSAGGAKPIKVAGAAWSALALHHTAFNTEPFTKLTFFVNGGMQGGQKLSVKVMVDNKPVDSTFTFEPKAKTWVIVEVPLKDISGAGKVIDGICLQGQGEAYAAYYINRIQLE